MKHDFIKFPLELILRPFSSYWDLKYEQRGKLKVAFTILALVIFTSIIQKQYSGFLVNFFDPRYLNSLQDITLVLVPFLLWCISNWAVTTLMEGEGRFKEIFIASAYAMTPIVVVYIPMIAASRFMTNEETAFFYLLLSVAAFWFIFLLIIGIMTIHQYTVARTIVTMILSVIVMGIIVFLASLVFSMLQQFYWFVVNIYRELIFRV